MNIHRKDKGFTIIEVVLVLAIAGLIFSMVFIALPALQRSQRDTQRKQDLSRAMTAVTNYAGNNRGSLPTDWNSFMSQYLTTAGDSFIDPAGRNSGQDSQLKTYTFVQNTAVDLTEGFNSDTTQNVIYYTTSSVCGTGGSVTKSGSRKVALRMYLEGGGVACQDN